MVINNQFNIETSYNKNNESNAYIKIQAFAINPLSIQHVLTENTMEKECLTPESKTLKSKPLNQLFCLHPSFKTPRIFNIFSTTYIYYCGFVIRALVLPSDYSKYGVISEKALKKHRPFYKPK